MEASMDAVTMWTGRQGYHNYSEGIISRAADGMKMQWGECKEGVLISNHKVFELV